MSSKKGTKKLNKLDIKKETITDLDVQDAEQVKGGQVISAGLMHCPTNPTGPIRQPPTKPSYTCPGK